MAAWCLLLILISSAASRLQPVLSNDSYQYISAAENLRNGRGLTTSLVHYESERRSGKIPAPVTIFPPAFPALLACLGTFGFSAATGGLILCLAATISVIPLMCWAGRTMGLPPAAIRLSLIAFVVNSNTSLYATSVLTDALFMLCVFAAITLLMSFLSDPGRLAHLAAGSVLLGLSVWIRYAGLFVILPVVLFFGIRLIFIRSRACERAMLWLLLPSMLLLLFGRNKALTGYWTGRNEVTDDVGWKVGMAKVVHKSGRLFLGDTIGHLHIAPLHVLFLLGVSFIGMAFIYVALSRDRSIASIPASILLPSFCVASYWSAMLYMAIHGHNSVEIETRYFYPLLPFITLLAGSFTCWLLAQNMAARCKNLLYFAFAMAGVSYLLLNAKDLQSQTRKWPHRAEQFLAADRGFLFSWLRQHIPENDVIIAEDGQATGYVLQRPTVSLASPYFAIHRWDETGVRELMEKYRAKYLIIYPGLNPTDDFSAAPSKFVTALHEDREPAWLKVAVENSGVRVYEYVADTRVTASPVIDLNPNLKLLHDGRTASMIR